VVVSPLSYSYAMVVVVVVVVVVVLELEVEAAETETETDSRLRLCDSHSRPSISIKQSFLLKGAASGCNRHHELNK